MRREYHRWFSPHLRRDMELLIFGHAGAKVLVFPTRDGRFYEYEDLGMVNAIRHKLEAGHLQLFCVDSIVRESFYNHACLPHERIQRHIEFERYILDEVMPLMVWKNGHECTISHGCSLGAYHAATIAFRHPHLFRKVAAFSGRYDLTLNVETFHNLFDGYYDETIYYHTPSHFLPHLQRGDLLSHLRRIDLVLTVGNEDPFLPNNRELSEVLMAKNLPHSLHVWDGRAHQGSAWRRMAPLYL
ncbi:MAG: alpha/beta hydrolase-fold protein [Verrucomicrobiales bacterium]